MPPRCKQWQDVETLGGSLNPLKSGDHGTLYGKQFHHDMHPLLGREISHNYK